VDALLLSLRGVLAAVFLVAAAGKLLDRQGSRRALQAFGVPDRFTAVAGWLLPVAEITVAAALLIRPSARWGAVGALLLLAVFIGAVAQAISHGRAPDCHCFGQIHSEPAGPATLVRNLILAVPAVVILAAGTGPSLDGGLRSLTGDQRALVAVSILAALLALVVAQLWGERRRLRRDLDALTAPSGPPGLPRGAPAPAFALTPVRGEAGTLGELMEPLRPAVLVFLSTNCGPCLQMLPTLAGWQASLVDSVSLPAIFAGERTEIERLSAEHGLSLVLAQNGDELFNLYALRATPSGVLIGSDGAIAGSPAEGVPAIEALIRSAVVPAPLVVHQA
jgi:uncharacterized membrane protein YphA (DoxX/SURF4 family)/thiol-disulfide isomerase/thioredoxin